MLASRPAVTTRTEQRSPRRRNLVRVCILTQPCSCWAACSFVVCWMLSCARIGGVDNFCSAALVVCRFLLRYEFLAIVRFHDAASVVVWPRQGRHRANARVFGGEFSWCCVRVYTCSRNTQHKSQVPFTLLSAFSHWVCLRGVSLSLVFFFYDEYKNVLHSLRMIVLF